MTTADAATDAAADAVSAAKSSTASSPENACQPDVKIEPVPINAVEILDSLNQFDFKDKNRRAKRLKNKKKDKLRHNKYGD